jgi:hypothetical protein
MQHSPYMPQLEVSNSTAWWTEWWELPFRFFTMINDGTPWLEVSTFTQLLVPQELNDCWRCCTVLPVKAKTLPWVAIEMWTLKQLLLRFEEFLDSGKYNEWFVLGARLADKVAIISGNVGSESLLWICWGLTCIWEENCFQCITATIYTIFVDYGIF